MDSARARTRRKGERRRRTATHLAAMVLAFALFSPAVLVARTSALAQAPATKPWQEVIRPADRVLIDPTESLINSLIRSIQPNADYVISGPGAFDKRDLLGLLQPGKRTETSDLVGRWRCRAIQPTSDAVYVYGFFQCDIASVDGQLLFRKLTGSQLRHGALYPDDGMRFVFLGRGNSLKKGLRSVYGDPAVEGSYFDLDSVGVFFGRGRGKVTAIFASAEYGYEIYDLRRD